MNILRMLIGMVGAVICFIGLVGLWAAWVEGASNATPWTMTIVGAVMWLQAVPILQASDREERRKRIREEYMRRDKN